MGQKNARAARQQQSKVMPMQMPEEASIFEGKTTEEKFVIARSIFVNDTKAKIIAAGNDHSRMEVREFLIGYYQHVPGGLARATDNAYINAWVKYQINLYEEIVATAGEIEFSSLGVDELEFQNPFAELMPYGERDNDDDVLAGWYSFHILNDAVNWLNGLNALVLKEQSNNDAKLS